MKTPYYDYMFIQAKEASIGKLHYNPLVTRILIEISKRIDDARIFKIPSVLSMMFLNTDPIKTYLLPFKYVFLEQSVFINNNLKVKGIFLRQLNLEEKSLLERPDEDVFFVFANLEINRIYTSVSFLMDPFQQRESHGLSDFDVKLSDEELSSIENLIYNFLCFVNSPDIEYTTYTDTPRQREIRRRKNRPIRPTIAAIQLTNPLKRYVTKKRHGIKMVYSHRFWVRGHWRTLRHKRYGENRGKKLWIKPHIKGEGLLIPKKYELITPEGNNDR